LLYAKPEEDGPNYKRKVILLKVIVGIDLKFLSKKLETNEISWFINDVLKFGPEYFGFYNLKYSILCSVENIKSFSDHLPNYVNHGYFDYVSFTDYDNCTNSFTIFFDNFNSEEWWCSN